MGYDARAVVIPDEECAWKGKRGARHEIGRRLTRNTTRVTTSLRTWAIGGDVKGVTIPRIASPTAMLVGLPDELSARSAELLADGGLRTLKVGHVAAASERIPIVMPHLVVVPTTLSPTEDETLADRCVAVGAEMLKIAPGTDSRALEVLLKDAANSAIVHALRRGH